MLSSLRQFSPHPVLKAQGNVWVVSRQIWAWSRKPAVPAAQEVGTGSKPASEMVSLTSQDMVEGGNWLHHDVLWPPHMPALTHNKRIVRYTVNEGYGTFLTGLRLEIQFPELKKEKFEVPFQPVIILCCQLAPTEFQTRRLPEKTTEQTQCTNSIEGAECQLLFQRTHLQFVAPTWPLTNIHNSSSKGSDTLFWSAWALGMHMVHWQTMEQNTHTYNGSKSKH